MTGPLDLRSEFLRIYGREPRIFRAPGRVNLIGEHTDYNDGFVMPAALEFATRAAVALCEGRSVTAVSLNYQETIAFDLDETNARPRGHWSDYVRGVAIMLENAGHKLRGASLLIEGGVPIGSGLSSSAALEVAVAFALLANAHIEPDRTGIALLCQKAENTFVGARTGIMDQFIACHGKKDHALLLDCRSLKKVQLPIPDSVRLVVCDTKVKHDLAAGEYNRRREECEKGVRCLRQFIPGLQSLRDVGLDELQRFGSALDAEIFQRCRHVITENARVLAAARALEAADLAEFGTLMLASHKSLRDDYRVSCRELDLLVDLALDARRIMPGIYGARMTGGGFGGSTVNLVDSAVAEDFASFVVKEYKKATGIAGAVYICAPADGADEEQGSRAA